MNFLKIPNIPNISIPNVPNIKSIDDVSSSLLNDVVRSVPDIITNSAIDSLPDISEILEKLFEKFLLEYNLSKNMGIAVIILVVFTIIIFPNLIVSFYSEFLNINTFYTYFLISIVCTSSILSFKLNRKNRDTVLYTNGIIVSIISVYTVYLAVNYPHVC